MLAYEPEGACLTAIYEHPSLKERDSFTVLDCGGGTVDITCHRLRSVVPLRLEELAAPSGGDWGSTYVDAAFEQFLSQFVGAPHFAVLKRSLAMLSIMDRWDVQKTQFKLEEVAEEGARRRVAAGQTGNNKAPYTLTYTPPRHRPRDARCSPLPLCSINMSDALEVLHQTEPELTLQSLVDTYNAAHSATLVSRMGSFNLRLPALLIASFFDTVVDRIDAHLRALCARVHMDYVILVGGFG